MENGGEKNFTLIQGGSEADKPQVLDQDSQASVGRAPTRPKYWTRRLAALGVATGALFGLVPDARQSAVNTAKSALDAVPGISISEKAKPIQYGDKFSPDTFDVGIYSYPASPREIEIAAEKGLVAEDQALFVRSAPDGNSERIELEGLDLDLGHGELVYGTEYPVLADNDKKVRESAKKAWGKAFDSLEEQDCSSFKAINGERFGLWVKIPVLNPEQGGLKAVYSSPFRAHPPVPMESQ